MSEFTSFHDPELISRNRSTMMGYPHERICPKNSPCDNLGCVDVPKASRLAGNMMGYLHDFRHYVLERKASKVYFSTYYHSFRQFFNYFGQSQFFIVRFDDFTSNFDQYLDHLAKYLTIKRTFQLEKVYETEVMQGNQLNQDSRFQLDCNTYDTLYSEMRDDYEKLSSLLNGPGRNKHMPLFKSFGYNRSACTN
jgi:hypothetical protein